MKKIQYSIARRETGNASGKAKRDAYNIALRMGYEPSYNPSSVQSIRVIQQFLTIFKFMGKKEIFFQYPAVSEQLMELFMRVVSKDSYKIALIHDLRSIQGLTDQDVKKEINFLNIFDCIIVHNKKMEEYVCENGYKGKTVVLNLFDYLHDADRPVKEDSFSNSISFAGNLVKAKFLRDLDRVDKCNWILYGITGDISFEGIENVVYKGLLPSDEIQYYMEGDYGLVWDGDSIDTCAGGNGEYLKYNNPHKLSLCIAAGKPVITWKNAAIAEFVNSHNIGITVDSLTELNHINLKENYEIMRENVLKLKKDIAEGKFLESAILEAANLGVKK